MSMPPPAEIAGRLLLEAFALPAGAAQSSFRRWRADADIDGLSPQLLQVLPMLAHRLPDWLVGDPARTTLLGVCRRAWARNQLLLKLLARAASALQEAGIARVAVAGSSAFALRLAPAKVVRALDVIEILVEPRDACHAFATLGALGWTAAGIPDLSGAEIERSEAVWLTDSGGHSMKLSWRLLPRGSGEAGGERLCDWRPTKLFGAPIGAISPSDLLVQALLGHRDERHIDWRWDALSLAPETFDWDRIASWIDGEAAATARLRELSSVWGFAVPAALLAPLGADGSAQGSGDRPRRRWWPLFGWGKGSPAASSGSK